MKVGFTGHRPNKLWGYDYEHPSYIALKEKIKKFLIEERVEEVYVGMAIGLDIIAALAAIEVRELGHSVKVVACIPCANQECKWSWKDQKLYWEVLRKCDTILGTTDNGIEVQLVTMFIDECANELYTLEPREYTVEYKPWLMQARNKIIVNHCDTLIALWDGTKGGTYNCIDYAMKTGRVNIIRWNPEDF